MRNISDVNYYNSKKLVLDCLNNKIVYENKNIDIEELVKPQSLIIYNEKIYITDEEDNSIKLFDINFNLIQKITHKEIIKPFYIRIINDKIFITSNYKNGISVYSINGDYLYSFGEEIGISSYIDIDNENIYVSSPYKNSIYIYHMDGILYKKIDCLFKYPQGIKLYEKYILVADQFNKRIVALDKTSNFNIKEFTSTKYFKIIYTRKNNIFIYDEYNDEEIKINIDDFRDFIEKNETVLEKIDIVPNIIQEFIKINDNLKLDKPKAICIKDDILWFSMHNHRTIVNYNLKENRYINFYKVGIQTEKILLTDTKVIILDYFFREILVANNKNLKVEYKIHHKDFVRIADIFLYGNKVYVLDSFINTVFVFNIFGKFIKKYKIIGSDNVKIKIIEEKIYILDKRLSKIYYYNMFFNLIKEYNLYRNSFPEDFLLDNNYFYICDDKKENIIRYSEDKLQSEVVENKQLPTNIVKYGDNFVISSYYVGGIKIINM
ncbi:MAG: hypothetical protein GX287_04895 [Fusobacteria bacterium]|nr:hypothetical protein [Fusobacteriota bacterium]